MNNFKLVFTIVIIFCITFSDTAEDEVSKYCRIRDLPYLYPQELWIYVAGFYCYNYTNDYRLFFKYKAKWFSYEYLNESLPIPLGWVESENRYITFDYRNDVDSSLVKKSYKTDYFYGMWQDCCREAEYCCDHFMNQENIYSSEEYPCPAIWDGWTCFAPAKKDTIEKLTCSKQAYSTEADVCELLSEKECFSNGTWNQQTNYGVCSIAPILRRRHTYNLITLAVAAVVAAPAVVIFFYFRIFRHNLRFVFHRNLILVIVVRNILSIMSKKIIILDALNSSTSNAMSENSVACRVLAFFENAAKNGMYACMLADGFYLHKLIVRPFANELKTIYNYIIVLVLSFLPSLIWAAVRGSRGAEDCWMVDTTNDQWIIDGFRFAILAINFLFLLDIIRVMITKLKHSTVSEQAKSTLKATVFLIPLFGLHIIIITNRNMVPSNTCEAQDIYFYISYTVESLQGIMVSVLFCYLNKEVQQELKKFYNKNMLYFRGKIQKDNVHHSRMKQSENSFTDATMVDQH